MAELEELGYRTVWLPEAVGREPFVNRALLLGATKQMVVATGIVGIWGRDAMTMAAGQLSLNEAFGGRFLLGIGVSHQPMVDYVRGHHYDKPLTTMRNYLDGMDTGLFFAAPPPVEPVRVLAALGPKMLELAAAKALGAHPYFVPVEHTARARQLLGPGPLLAPEVAVVLETDPAQARALAREYASIYLGLPNYTNNLRRLGWGDDDLGNGGSDKLVDAIVAWGTTDNITTGLHAHLDAGADHVAIQVLTANDHTPMPAYQQLAQALL